MSLQIERGLFSLDFIDYYAILGTPLDADVKDIRKRYLKIARRLHPDSCASETEADRQFASQLLSKLVNPAWEKLSQERDRTEYQIILKMKGQQQPSGAVEILGSLAKQLLTASNPDHFYLTSLKDLVSKQYDHLDQTTEVIGQLSELNLVYLMRKEGKGISGSSESKKAIYTGSNLPDSSQGPGQQKNASAPPPSGQSHRSKAGSAMSAVDSYYRRAEEFASKGNYAQATLELRDALQVEPNNGRCHSLMGLIYLKQNQATMAKIHFNKALAINPEDPMALQGKNKLENPQAASGNKAGAKTAGNAKANPQKGDTKANKPNDKPGSGGLFGLFGGKKK